MPNGSNEKCKLLSFWTNFDHHIQKIVIRATIEVDCHMDLNMDLLSR